MEEIKRIPFGIDLSTNNICVAFYADNKYQPITDTWGGSTIPSYLAFTDSEVLFGEAAREQLRKNAANTIYDVNYLIGRRYEDPLVQNGMKRWPFSVVAGPGKSLEVELRMPSMLHKITPVQIYGEILKNIKKKMEEKFGTIIADVVVTVPVHFNYEQRLAIGESAKLAGLDFLQIISAPAAIALDYRPKQQSGIVNRACSYIFPESYIIIIDLGAGTLDVSLVIIKKDVSRVVATARDYDFSINETNFNKHNTTLLSKIWKLVHKCVHDKNIRSTVDEIIVTGDSAGNAMVEECIQQVKRYFNNKNVTIKYLNPTDVAYGASYQASYLSSMENGRGDNLPTQDATPVSLTLETSQGVLLHGIPRNTNIPYKMENDFPSYSKLHSLDVYEVDERVQQKNFIGKVEPSNTQISSNECSIHVCFQINLNGTLSLTKGQSEMMVSQSGKPEEHTIAIDFGTTYSRVAVWQGNGVMIFENEYGSRLTCSAVAFNNTGRMIGDKVYREQSTTDPANTIPNIKRLIGRYFSELSIEKDGNFLPFRVQSDDKNRSSVSVHYKSSEEQISPEEIAAMVLSKMKEIAETQLNSKVSKAVISVPASFRDSQRKAIKDAGAIAGLEVMQLLNEPSAAAIAYFMQNICDEVSTKKTLLIFDLGGGNLDVSVVVIKERAIVVQAVAGDTNLGGEDFDNNMVDHFVDEFMVKEKIDIKNKPKSLRKLRAACEKAKRDLSIKAQTKVEIDALYEGIDFCSVITRKKFEELNKGLFQKSISYVQKCLDVATLHKSSIDEVVLVGGSTRIPEIQRLLQEFFNGKELNKSMNADEAVVRGAAIQAAILSVNDNKRKVGKLRLQDVTSLSFGLELKNKDGEAVLNYLPIPNNTPIPVEKELIFSSKLTSFSIEVQEYDELASTIVFSLSGITPNQSGNSKVHLLFKVDKSGILNLTAKDTSAREKSEIVISKENGGLTEVDIEKMKIVEAHRMEEDRQNKRRAAALNHLEKLVYKIKKNGQEVSRSHKKIVEQEVDAALKLLEANRHAPHASIDEINHFVMHLEAIKPEEV